MNLSKESQLAYRRRRRLLQGREGYRGPESDLQAQMDDMLLAMGIEFRRIPDRIWQWLQYNAPPYMIKQLSRIFKGKPDTMILIPINKKYSLCREVEIKNYNGVLSKNQQAYAERMPVTISRSTEENERAVLETIADAEKIKKIIEGDKS